MVFALVISFCSTFHFVVAQVVKNLPAMQETRVRPLGQDDAWEKKDDAWRREWLLTPVLLPGEFHGLRILVGYSPRGHKEWDTIERLTLSVS